jgi:S-DNA-T family DNA segregation ATPase FtsK/SpoIIIE
MWMIEMALKITALIIKWALRVLSWLTVKLGHAAITHPRTTVAVATLGAGVLALGWLPVVLMAALIVLVAGVWNEHQGASFERCVGRFLRTWATRWWNYRRVWTKVMSQCGLSVLTGADKEEHAPELSAVSTSPYWDSLDVRMVIGQELEDYQKAAQKLRHAFRCERSRVSEIKPGRVRIALMRRDPLRENVPATPIPLSTSDVDFHSLRIGVTEHLEPLCVSVLGAHTANSGSPGAGKAALQWNILRALAPAIADGSVRPIFIDPKHMELRQALRLVHPDDYAASKEDVVALLQRLTEEMMETCRAKGLAGDRDHVPTPNDPLRLIIIDELAPLLAYWDRRTRDRCEEMLGLILAMGRASGYIVIGNIQEPTKDVFKVRDLFGRRFGMRLPTVSFTNAALADDAEERGAVCHHIPESMPGTLYALKEGDGEAIRARLGYVTDEDIAELVGFVELRRTVPHIDIHHDEDEGRAAA